MPGRVLMLTRYMRPRLLSENVACKSCYEQLVKNGVGRKYTLNLHQLVYSLKTGGDCHFMTLGLTIPLRVRNISDNRQPLYAALDNSPCTDKLHL